MYFCNDCGQCNHITDDNFHEVADISGTETRYINCITGDVEDYGDSDTSATGDSAVYCPHCDGDDIDCDWDGEEDEANATRKKYQELQAIRRAESDHRRLVSKMKDSDWDLGGN